ncbi:hypothetical protein DAPPUDRAFT_263640 [Daphnia pulex]|uniref:Uncharacterized protein n=1 Tax=Daphnia pulex TaxID=6669 RepID=E9HQ57_DAPPU|nr:hypothetical protein DAPPUDRAFT_263640 [Daphnia pulex]|eukprot:EFX66110.1 hypothetical protein DAPPUDRAFT_263640 [Daphnia pulex]
MEGISVDPPKEKLGTPSFLKSIQNTLLHKLSPKQFKRRPKAPKSDDRLDVYGSQEGYEEEEDIYEEDAAEDPANCRSFEEQREEWAHTKGKSLARTPVNKPRFYPDLTQEVEGEGPVDYGSDDGDDESVDEAGPSKPIKKTRRVRVNPLSTVGTKKIDGFSVGWPAVMCLHTREKKSAKAIAPLAVFLMTYLQN